MRPPAIGADVIVEWVDSGAGETGKPAANVGHLSIGRTHGHVTAVAQDARIHERVCRRGRCRCTYIELAMCSSGPGDDRSDLAYIWWDAVVSVVEHGAA